MSQSHPDTAAPALPSVENGGEAGASRSVTPEDPPIDWKRVLWVFSPLMLLGVLIALEVPLCPSKSMLGIPCPGCGLTRATEALMTGDVSAMLRLHPMAPFLTPVAVFSVIRASAISAGLMKSSRLDPLGRLPNWFWVSALVVLLGLWIARMLGFFGGLPDPIDPANGYIGRALSWIWTLF